MTLLNGILALGALAFTVPLAIHLLYRSRFKMIEWGAMYLLDSIVRVNRRRMQLTEILLLLVRCAIPILLAIALARPVLTQFRALPGDAPQTVVIAIDDSRSMSAMDEVGQTAMQRAAEGLKLYLSKLSRRDEIMLLTSSRASLPVATMGRDEAIRQIAEIQPDASQADLDLLLRSATAALNDASHLERRILLVSDFLSRDVSDSVLEGAVPLERVLTAMSPAPRVMMLNVGSPTESTNNLYIEAVESDAVTAVKNRTLRLSARIRNDTDRPGSDVPVTWFIDDEKVNTERIAIQPRASSTSRFSHKFETPGVHVVRVHVDWPDALVADNQRHVALNVIDGVNVLLVDGQPSDKPLEGETDFLSIALSPFSFGSSALPDAIRSQTIKASGDPTKQINESLEKLAVDAIVLANVAEPSPALRSTLAGFVSRGGSLVIFDGSRIKPEAYNVPWVSEAAGGDSSTGASTFTLPYRLDAIAGDIESREQAGAIPARLNANYVSWASVMPDVTTALDGVDIFAHRKLVLPSGVAQAEDNAGANDGAAPVTPNDNASDTPPSEDSRIVLMQTARGEPLAVLGQWGRGNVVQFAIPCDGEWTTLPLRPVFLPMMQQLVIDSASGSQRTNVAVGQSMIVPATEFRLVAPATQTAATSGNDAKQDAKSKEQAAKEADEKLAAALANATYTVEPPAKKELPVKLVSLPGSNEPSQLIFDAYQGVGAYRFRQVSELEGGESRVAVTTRVAEVDPGESQLRPAPDARTMVLVERIGATLHRDADSLVSDETVNRFGREVWRWVLALLLVALIAEMFLQQMRLRAGSTKTNPSPGAGEAARTPGTKAVIT